MAMAKKTVKKAKAKEDVPPVPQAPIEFEAPEPETAPPEPSAPKEQPKSGGSALKILAILILMAMAAYLAYYFLTASGNIFETGSEVDAETFKNTFASSPLIYIVMDVRGVNDQLVSNNVLQCGVDFAGSTGMGGKDAVYLSFGNEGCTAPDGAHPMKDCVSMLKDGIVIYVKGGSGGAKYYSNGMVVTVGKNYTLGTCGIHKY